MSRRPWWQQSGPADAWSWSSALRSRDAWSGPWTAPSDVGRPRTDAGPPATPLAEVDLPLPPAPPVQAKPEPVFVDLSITTSDGVACTGVDLQIQQVGSDQEPKKTTTDATGRARVVVDSEGSYEVSLARPITLPPPPAEPKTAPVWSRKIAYDERSVVIPSGQRQDVIVLRPAAIEVILDGWAQASSVMRWGGMRVRRDESVGTARASIAKALWLGRGKTICMFGHADPLGSDADNEALAVERAKSVYLFTSGDLDAWASHAFGHGTKVDWACAMVACARILGMQIPGLDDSKALSAVRTAVRANGIDGDPIPDSAPPSADDWRAVGEIYEQDLADLLLTDRAGLAQIREAITWSDPPVVTVGERWPRTPAEMIDKTIGLAGPPAPMHRRVSLVVLGPSDGPTTLPGTDGAALYDGTYARVVIDPPGEVLVEIQVDTPSRDPIARGRAWVSVANLGAYQFTAADDGAIRFPALLGDRVQVVAAFDAQGRGTMTAMGIVTKDKGV